MVVCVLLGAVWYTVYYPLSLFLQILAILVPSGLLLALFVVRRCVKLCWWCACGLSRKEVRERVCRGLVRAKRSVWNRGVKRVSGVVWRKCVWRSEWLAERVGEWSCSRVGEVRVSRGGEKVVLNNLWDRESQEKLGRPCFTAPLPLGGSLKVTALTQSADYKGCNKCGLDCVCKTKRVVCKVDWECEDDRERCEKVQPVDGKA